MGSPSRFRNLSLSQWHLTTVCLYLYRCYIIVADLQFIKQAITYIAEHVIGTGSFGVVFQVSGVCFQYIIFTIILEDESLSVQAKCRETGEIVAIKKVLQDKRYKNRELQIMHMLDHPNIVALKHCFFSTTNREEIYLNLVLEFVPETVNRISRHYNKMNLCMPLIYVKLYTYQVCFTHFLSLSIFQSVTFPLFRVCLFVVFLISTSIIFCLLIIG